MSKQNDQNLADDNFKYIAWEFNLIQIHGLLKFVPFGLLDNKLMAQHKAEEKQCCVDPIFSNAKGSRSLRYEMHSHHKVT